PPEVGIVCVLVAEVGFAEGVHHRRTGATIAVLAELEQATQRRRLHAAEEVILDHVGRGERLVRDPRRDPGEEMLHRVRGGRDPRDAQEEALQEDEEVFHADDGRRAVDRRRRLRAATRRVARRPGDAVGAAELASARQRVEARVTGRPGELAAEEGAVAADAVAKIVGIDRRAGIVAERVQHAWDGDELLADLALVPEALLVAARDDCGERGEAPRGGVVRDRGDRTVAGEKIEVRRRRRRDRRAALHAATLARSAVVAVSLIVRDEEGDVRARDDGRLHARLAVAGADAVRRTGQAAGA